MSLAAPWWLALMLVPVAAGLLARWRAVRRGGEALPAMLRALVGGGRVRVAGPRDPGGAVPWRLWLALAALAVALARPQWGAPEQATLAPGQLVIALDLSRSMLADDALPNRLERARALATRLVAARPADRIGLIAFAGDAWLLAPPSADRAVLLGFLPTIGPEHVRRPGTDFARLIGVAAGAFDRAAGGARTLVLLSDGEAEAGPWRARLGTLRAAGVRVVAYGIGTAAGAPLRLGGRPLEGSSGRPVVSRLQPAALKALAEATGGAYLDAAHGGDLAAAVSSAERNATAGPADTRAAPERFRLFVALAAALLAWSIAVEWPAAPRLRRRGWRAGGAALATAGALVAALPAGGVPRIDPELHGLEPDPLLVMKQAVAAILAKRAPDADDYQRVADTATRYGEVHRGHAHPLELGVLRDGLAAIEAGRRLDPHREAWGYDHARLLRLLQPPKPPADTSGKPGDPADDPADVQDKRPGADQDRQKPGQGADRDKRDVGGARREVYDRAEWRIASLVRPLSLMERVRRQDSPAELFRLMQPEAPGRHTGQTW